VSLSALAKQKDPIENLPLRGRMDLTGSHFFWRTVILT
jgi:hypothetical protein